MPQDDKALVEVAQADRARAADFFSDGGPRNACLAGQFDDRPIVQAFARHRIESQASDKARIEAYRTMLTQAEDDCRKHIARIEALEAENARLRVFVERMARQQTIDEMDDDDRIDADWEGGFGYFVAEARTIVENRNVD